MKKANSETEAIRAQLKRTQYREHSVPLFLTSSFTFGDAHEMAGMFAGDIDIDDEFGSITRVDGHRIVEIKDSKGTLKGYLNQYGVKFFE